MGVELTTERSFCSESSGYPAIESILCNAPTRTANGRNVKSIRYQSGTATGAANPVRLGRVVSEQIRGEEQFSMDRMQD